MSCVAVIDVETTGLWPQRYHRIVELAVIVACTDGTVIREFVTLINPERDLGPTHIHGLSACDIFDAPRFHEIAGALLEILEGCAAIAGHNVRFDHSFLVAEFDRLGVALPEIPLLCTMRLAGGGRLTKVCSDYGIEFAGQSHSAYIDALATTHLLTRLLNDRPDLISEASNWPAVTWPMVPKSPAELLTRKQAHIRRSQAPSYMAGLIAKLPTAPNIGIVGEAHLAYLDLLSQVLEDRRVDRSEGEALIELATNWGMTADCIRQTNRNYLLNLADVALSDGILSDSERRDLCQVASLLGVGQRELDSILDVGRSRTAPDRMSLSSGGTARAAPELVGKSVCFTGECQCHVMGALITRETANQIALRHGLIPANGVTKKLDLLVVADGFTESSKARKARQCGIRIMHESVFWNAIGVDVE